MRNGRGANPDHDQKSVDQPRKMTPPARVKRMLIKQINQHDKSTKYRVSERRCSGRCGQSYSTAVINGVAAFSFDNTDPDGYQRECRVCRNARDFRSGIIVRGRALIAADGVEAAWISAHGGVDVGLCRYWLDQNGSADDEPFRVPKCRYCPGRLGVWIMSHARFGGGGSFLDRENNLVPHTPENVVLACIPCNIERNATDIGEWWHTVDDRNRRHPNGWDAIRAKDKRFKPAEQLDLSAHVCGWRQGLLF